MLKPEDQDYQVPFVNRTGLRYYKLERGYCHALMPLEPNANHVNVMYMGAYTVLAEATAVSPGVSVLDKEKYFPIVKDIAVDFHRMAASDVTAEYRLSEEKITELLADLERKGSTGYQAEVPMIDSEGTLVATGKVTVKILSHQWKA